MKIKKKHVLLNIMAEHINIRSKSVMGNYVNMWNLGLQVGHEQADRSRASLSIDDKRCLSIDV